MRRSLWSVAAGYYNSAQSANFTTAKTVCPLDTSFLVSESFTSIESNEITVNFVGPMKVDVQVGIRSVSGNNRSQLDSWVERDTGGGWTEVSGTRMTHYVRGYVNNGASGSAIFLIENTPGDKYRLVCQRLTGSSTFVFKTDACRFVLERL